MNTFTVVFLCIQACLVQNVFSQCTSRAAVAADGGLLAPFGLAGSALGARGLGAAYGLAPAGALGYGSGYGGAYGGAGEGNVAVAGELPVAGTTALAGQVPIMGAVRFAGDVGAAGAVSIAGQCACGCGSPYDYVI